jgi:tRNA-dihydrouridine synthase B
MLKRKSFPTAPEKNPLSLVFDDPEPEIGDENLPAPPAIASRPLNIGSVPIPSRFFLAPMAGFTSLAFRVAVRELGGLGLATTDLVNARSLIEKRTRSLEIAETNEHDRPVAIQIYGHVPNEMIEAAKRVVDLGATIVDINMGCPVRKVVRSGGGSALLCDSGGAARLVEGIVAAVNVPVTVKTRLGWDDENPTAPELARALERVGVAALIVHGRTRAQGFKGRVDRIGIGRVVDAVESMPVIGNGDVRSIADAERMFRESRCAAISIGRGALADPFFFRRLSNWAETGDPGPDPTFDERVNVMERCFRGLVELRGEKIACLQFRKLVKWYYHFTHMPKPIYLSMINLASVAAFDRALVSIRAAGPSRPLGGGSKIHIPVPSGPIDKW